MGLPAGGGSPMLWSVDRVVADQSAAGHRHRRGALVAAMLAITVVAAGCQRVPQRVFDVGRPQSFAVHYLTRDGNDGFDGVAQGGRLTFTATAINTG